MYPDPEIRKFCWRYNLSTELESWDRDDSYLFIMSAVNLGLLRMIYLAQHDHDEDAINKIRQFHCVFEGLNWLYNCGIVRNEEFGEFGEDSEVCHFICEEDENSWDFVDAMSRDFQVHTQEWLLGISDALYHAYNKVEWERNPYGKRLKASKFIRAVFYDGQYWPEMCEQAIRDWEAAEAWISREEEKNN